MSELKSRAPHGLDAFDLQILSLLQRDGRITKVKLAELIGLSATPCGARIERLEKMGLIRGYHADLNLTELTRLTRFRVTISIRNWTPIKARRFEGAIAKIPNIVDCEAVLGDIDYIVTVLATSISHYQELIGALIASVTDELDYTTYPVSKSLKREVEVSFVKLATEETPHT